MSSALDADVVIITGAGRGIGEAVAKGLARPSRSILAISQTETAERTANAVRAAGGKADALQIDLAECDRVEAAVGSYLKKFPGARIAVILAAGILGPSGDLLAAQSLTEWEAPFRVNVLGNMSVVRAALPQMQAVSYGRVAALAGGGSAYAYPEFSAYALSKTALVREIENLGASHTGTGLVFMALAPGAVETEMLARVRAEGGVVRTTTSAQETVKFSEAFITHECTQLSGRFLHVRDDWSDHLDPGGPELSKDHWKLRRVE